MRLRTILATTATLGAGLVLGPLAEPATGTITPTASGTTVGVTVSGFEYVRFTCVGSKVRVNDIMTSPAVGCSVLTQVTVLGDGDRQLVYGTDLDDPVFAAGPKLVASLAGGDDYASETRRADQIDLGDGSDALELYARGAANTSVAMGPGAFDYAAVRAVAGTDDDSMVVTSTGATATVVTTNGYGANVRSVTGADSLSVYGDFGNDTIDGTGVTLASGLSSTVYDGGAGNDVLKAGPGGSTIYGGAGANTLVGGVGQDGLHSGSETDALDPAADASTDYLYDEASPRSGGRTYTNLSSNDVVSQLNPLGDVVHRFRPIGTTGSRLTTSLTRPGQQTVPAVLGYFGASSGTIGAPAHQVLIDAVAGPNQLDGGALTSDRVLLDVTVPTGAWTVTEGSPGSGYVVVDPGAAGLANVSGNQVDDYEVHGPWTNKNQGFGHRVTRDLLFRFPTNAARDAIRDQLTTGTRTRNQVARSLIATDEYRGLDVDRVFLAYLRRASDPSGRTYWINALRGGRSLRQFRAQLFGSSEYFTKNGSSNASYVAAAYRDVLGRAPDPSGQAYWTNKIDTGTDRGTVAKQFLATPEAARNVVSDQFLRFLDRQPTATEQTTWSPTLGGSTGEQDLIAFLAASTAYYDRT